MGMTKVVKYRIQKTDRRMSGVRLFTHRIKVYWNEDFLKYRTWMFETFGPACELELFEVNQALGLDYVWAWRSDHYRREIYVNEAELSAFILHNS